MTTLQSPVAVYGASGHTGGFVVRELQRRGIPVVAVGRDAARLPAGVPARQAALDDPAGLDAALAGCSVVIHCAGPFMDTADPVVAAALRAGCNYIDVTAEQASTGWTLERHDAAAQAAGVAVIPAAGFFGGLGGLLAAALAGNAAGADITVGMALDHWWPTAGTRETGARNTVPRRAVEGGRQVPVAQPPPGARWDFGEPFGTLDMVELPFSETIAIDHHLRPRSLHSWMALAPLQQLRDAATPPPTAVDADGRSAQRFALAVQRADAGGRRSAVAAGQDIYAVSAPIAVEAAQRLRQAPGSVRGAMPLAQAFDARAFLGALAPRHIALAFDTGVGPVR